MRTRTIALPLLVALVRTTAVAAQADVPSERHGPELTVTGTVLLNGFYTSTTTNNSDVPQFVVPPSGPPSGLPDGGAGGTIRQTRVRGLALWSDVAGGELRGEIDVDFFGGQQPSPGGRTFPLLRIRRAVAQLAWDRIELLFGQEVPPIAELNPTTLAEVGVPEFGASGNLWLWIPQVRVTGLTPVGTAKIGAEVAVLAPTSGDPQTAFTTQPDIAERSRRPYLQARLLARWGQGATAGDLSIGGHLGWLATTGDTLLQSRAVAVSARIPLAKLLELRGEAFLGEAIAGLGGGAIGQNFGPGSRRVSTRGGWAQLGVKPARAWEFGAGYGIDDPDDADLDVATPRLRNETWQGYVHWRTAPVVIGLEYRQIKTRYGAGDLKADHVNLALGLEF